MNKNVRISDLCSHLNRQHYQDMDVENMTDLKPSQQRIEDIVLKKLHTETTMIGKREHMKKKTGKILLIAAIFCLFATTAFAMAGGLDYFRAIFGNTADNAGHVILSPGITVSDDSRRLSLESMLTDGYKINLIVSLDTLSGKKDSQAAGKDPFELFQVDLEPVSSIGGEAERTASYTCSELTEFQLGSKHLYHLQLDSLVNCSGWNLDISLPDDMGGLSLSTVVEGMSAARELSISQPIDDNLTVETIQLSQLGILVIGNEAKASGGLPAPPINLIFKDGSQEELISPMSFDAGDGETVTGGGGAVIGADNMTGPLVIGTHGQRNPDGKVVIAGEFGRIIRMDDVKSLWISGVEYPVG